MNELPPTNDGKSTTEFYLPATFQFSKRPGLVERFLAKQFGMRQEARTTFRPQELEYGFYLPGTTRSGTVLGKKRPRPR